MRHNETRELVIRTLKELQPISSGELAKVLGMSQEAAGWHLKCMHRKKPKQAYISDYQAQRFCGRDVIIWCFGDAEDAVRPVKKRGVIKEAIEIQIHRPFTPEEESREERLERRMEEEIQRQKKKLAAEIKPFRDTMIFLTAGRAT